MVLLIRTASKKLQLVVCEKRRDFNSGRDIFLGHENETNLYAIRRDVGTRPGEGLLSNYSPQAIRDDT